MAWAELSDVRCYYELIGEGEPLLLVPGLGNTCRVWDPIVPYLAQHFSLILFDNRGMGRSEQRRKPNTLADYSCDMAQLLDHLQLDRTHVLGLSLGGIIAQRLVLDHPSRIDRLVLVSCTDRFSAYTTRIAALLGHSLRSFSRKMFLQTMELLGTAPLYLDEHIDEIDQQMAEKSKNGVPARAMGTQLRCLIRSAIDPADYRITAPTLVIAGEHDALIPSCYARMMAGKIPNSRFVLVRGSGHNPMAEQPDTALPMVVRFLRDGQLEEPATVSGRVEAPPPTAPVAAAAALAALHNCRHETRVRLSDDQLMTGRTAAHGRHS